MGRGAGNTQTERLLTILSSEFNKYQPEYVYDLAIRYFESMQKSCGWGTNLLYFLGAQHDVHPTYIQNLLSDEQYGTEEIIAAIGYLSKLEGTSSYDGSVLEAAVNFNSSDKEVSGSKDLVDLFAGNSVLIVANGESTKKHRQGIEQFISKNKPIVISVNINESIPSSFIDYYIVSHNVKFLTDSEKYKNLNKPLILPKHRFETQEIAELSNVKCIDFGFENTSDDISVHEGYVDCKLDYTSSYLLGALLVARPEKVFLAGFDGYCNDDKRQLQMIKLSKFLYE